MGQAQQAPTREENHRATEALELIFINLQVAQAEAEAFHGHINAAALEMPPGLPGEMRSALAQLYTFAEESMIRAREETRLARSRLRAAGIVS